MHIYNPFENLSGSPLSAWASSISSQDPTCSVVALPVFYNCPDCWPGIQIKQQRPELYAQDFSQYKHVILTSWEPTRTPQDIKNWVEANQFQSVSVVQGTKPTQGWQDRPDWFYSFCYLPWFLCQNQPQAPIASTGKYLFDVLLGARRPHRDFVMSKMTQSGLLEQSIVTYRGRYTKDYRGRIRGFKWPYESPNLDASWDDKDASNFLPPWKIYQQTRYSIVCETIDNGFEFIFTEKTFKAMWARRVFVIFGVQYFLKNLHELGFKTFGDVIDESYDDIADPYLRWHSAWSAVEQLSKMDYATVLSATSKITQHNRQRLLTLNHEIQVRSRQRLDQIRSQFDV